MERKGISFLFTGCLQYAYLISFFRPALIPLPGHIGQYIFFGLISEHFLIKCYLKKLSWIQHFHTALHSLDYWRWLCLDGPWKGQHVKCASSQKTAYSLCGRILDRHSWKQPLRSATFSNNSS